MSDTVATLDIDTSRVRSISLDELPGISLDEWLDTSGRIQFADGPQIRFQRIDGRIYIEGFEEVDDDRRRTVEIFYMGGLAARYEVDDEKFEAIRGAIWNILASTEGLALERVRDAWSDAWEEELRRRFA